VVRRALLGAWLAAGCASSDHEVSYDGFPPREYIFAGQTGSLVPSCGVAPLSQGQLAVPVGDALAVLYTSGCPEVGTARLDVIGPDAQSVAVRLEPLGSSGVYLVRVDESLSAGDYQLDLPDQSSSTLSVADAAAPLPASLGSISALPQSSACESDVVFEWALDADALAHAPLLRLWVRVDGGSEQLWVDYGALQVDEATGVAELRLPRCGSLSCLLDGGHGLEMRAEIAGESAAPMSLRTSFDVVCPDAAVISASSTDTNESAGCSLGAPARPERSGFAFLGAILALRRWTRRRSAGLSQTGRSS
jgi:hypothetical protein